MEESEFGDSGKHTSRLRLRRRRGEGLQVLTNKDDVKYKECPCKVKCKCKTPSKILSCLLECASAEYKSLKLEKLDDIRPSKHVPVSKSTCSLGSLVCNDRLDDDCGSLLDNDVAFIQTVSSLNSRKVCKRKFEQSSASGETCQGIKEAESNTDAKTNSGSSLQKYRLCPKPKIKRSSLSKSNIRKKISNSEEQKTNSVDIETNVHQVYASKRFVIDPVLNQSELEFSNAVNLNAERTAPSSGSSCPVCQGVFKNLKEHVDKCNNKRTSLGANDLENVATVKDVAVELMNNGIFLCHICQKDISHMNSQRKTQHINKCIDQTEISSKKQSKIKVKKSRCPKQPKSKEDEQLQVAIALSRSLNEQEMIKKPTKKQRKKKKLQVTPLLVKVTSEIRLKNLEEKISQILQASSRSNSKGPSLQLSALNICKTGVVKKLQFQTSKQKNLWLKASLQPGDSYYVDKLNPPISPKKGKLTGAAFRSYSMIPGRRKSTAVSFNIPEDAISIDGIGNDAANSTIDQALEGGTECSQTVELLAMLATQGKPMTTLNNQALKSIGFCPDVQESCESPTVTKCLSDYEGLIDNSYLSDAQIKCQDGQIVHIHQIIIAARSPSLLEVLEAGEGVVDVGHVNFDSVIAMLRFVYCAKIEVPPYCLKEVLDLANKFHLTELSHSCHQSLEQYRLNATDDLNASLHDVYDNVQLNFTQMLKDFLTESNDENGNLDKQYDGRSFLKVQPTFDELNDEDFDEIYEFKSTQRERDDTVTVNNYDKDSSNDLSQDEILNGQEIDTDNQILNENSRQTEGSDFKTGLQMLSPFPETSSTEMHFISVKQLSANNLPCAKNKSHDVFENDNIFDFGVSPVITERVMKSDNEKKAFPETEKQYSYNCSSSDKAPVCQSIITPVKTTARTLFDSIMNESSGKRELPRFTPGMCPISKKFVKQSTPNDVLETNLSTCKNDNCSSLGVSPVLRSVKRHNPYVTSDNVTGLLHISQFHADDTDCLEYNIQNKQLNESGKVVEEMCTLHNLERATSENISHEMDNSCIDLFSDLEDEDIGKNPNSHEAFREHSNNDNEGNITEIYSMKIGSEKGDIDSMSEPLVDNFELFLSESSLSDPEKDSVVLTFESPKSGKSNNRKCAIDVGEGGTNFSGYQSPISDNDNNFRIYTPVNTSSPGIHGKARKYDNCIVDREVLQNVPQDTSPVVDNGNGNHSMSIDLTMSSEDENIQATSDNISQGDSVEVDVWEDFDDNGFIEDANVSFTFEKSSTPVAPNSQPENICAVTEKLSQRKLYGSNQDLLENSDIWNEKNKPRTPCMEVGESSETKRKTMKQKTYFTPHETVKPKKKWTVPSPFTPMANYIAMTTPQLKGKLTDFGIKPAFKRKRMVKILTDIYHQSHQYETDSEFEQSTHLPNTKPPAVEFEETCQNLEDKLNTSTESLESNCGGVADMIEESFAVEDDSTTSEQLQVNLKQQTKLFMQGKTDFYRDVLLYKPFILEDFHEEINEAGIKCGKSKLIEMFDEWGVTFRFKKKEGNRHERKRKKTSKKLSKKLDDKWRLREKIN